MQEKSRFMVLRVSGSGIPKSFVAANVTRVKFLGKTFS